MRRALTLVLGVTLSIVGCGGPEGPSAPTSSAASASILILGADEAVQARPIDPAMAAAFGAAMDLAVANGKDLGYPWIDPANGQLVISVVSEQGRQLVEHAGPGVPYRFRTVAHGAAELQMIQDKATTLTVPGAQLIYMTLADQRDNRALLVIKSN